MHLLNTRLEHYHYPNLLTTRMCKLHEQVYNYKRILKTMNSYLKHFIDF
jgi:hypothetical protein